MIEARVIFHGKVHGVFFRKCVLDHSKSFLITGIVRNLSNGTVEAIFQGEKSEIERVIESIKKDPGRGSLHKVEVKLQEPQNIYTSFSIEY